MGTELRRARQRQMFIFLLVCLGTVVLLARLYYWQVLQSQSGYKLAQLANNEHIQNLIVDAPRGLIYDIQGWILATNVVRDDVYVEPVQFTIQRTAYCTYRGRHRPVPKRATAKDATERCVSGAANLAYLSWREFSGSNPGLCDAE